MPQTTIRQHWIDTPQGRLFAQCWTPDHASEAPVVLMHDSLGCVGLWRDFPLHLAQHCGRCVIAYDRLGFGRSSPRPGTLSPDFIETEAYEGFACLYRQLGLDRFVVLGHSVGGCMAVNCAAAWPHACAGVITESAQAFVDEDIRAGIRAAEQQFARPGPWQRLHQYHGDKTAQVLRAWIDT
ncbi:alpha/beta hydrolase [Laribacter hongkongensis]|uniref:alpha/beta hydrolase n=1 Tax=Laribacter hongkongensis TaxID=168471 RepID=UPI001EFCC083|nr:alpha/beta fold hydrolase [Laribacter hongkongensis]MCG9054297.1 alpha/beta hydrolase [Laribacter hongkongensis]